MIMQQQMIMPNPEYLARLAMRQGDDAARLADYRQFADYYDGAHKEQLPSKSRNRLEKYLDFRANICDVIVDALAERLVVTGVDVTGPGDEAAEKRLAFLWQRNRMDEDSGTIHHEAAKLGDSYAIVDWDRDKRQPRFSYNPAAVISMHYSDPANKIVHCAVKSWESGDMKLRRRNVYFADRVERYSIAVNSAGQYASQDWKPYTDAEGGPVVPWVDGKGKPLGVPVFHFRNKAKGDAYGRSELLNVVALQDAINKTLIDLLLVLDRQGWPQLWVKGKRPADGWPVGPGIVWSSDNPDFAAGSIDAANPDGLAGVLMQLINTTAGRSRTPQHLFHIDGAYPSGEALKTADAGLAGKVRDRQISFGNTWEDACLMALRLDNAFGGAAWALDEVAINCEWQDAEIRNDLAHAQTVSTKAPWLPLTEIWRQFGYTDAQIGALQIAWDKEQADKADAGTALLEQFRTGGQAPADAVPNDKPGGQGMTRNPDRQHTN